MAKNMAFYNIKGKLQRNLHVFSTFTQNLNLEHFILNVFSAAQFVILASKNVEKSLNFIFKKKY
jgi:hypothetical protein